jgi:hypothetical protein
MKVGTKLSVESLEVDFGEADRLVLKGVLSTPTAQSEFKRLLQELHTEIVSSRAQSFNVDVRGLTFVNSSAIRAFVDWISRAAHAGYKLSFTTSAAITWHRLSFSVLKTLAPESVEILEERPGGAA